MSTKQKLLALLEQSKGVPLSGQALADGLGISRAAVWKAIKELQKAGHGIDAATHAGYTLRTESDVLSPEGIAAYLAPSSAPVHVYSMLESTNITAKQLAAKGAPHGTLVVANHQTAGRGRRGRSFASPAGTGLYLTMVLRSGLPMGSAALITSAAAVAVCRALHKVCNKDNVQIKWVNDLYYRGKKCCGILTEASADVETGGVDFLVVGIGLNLFLPTNGFPEDVAQVAGALFTPEETAPRCHLAAAIATELLALCDALPSAAFMEEYRAKNIIPGKEITILQHSGNRRAKALSITDEGHLVVQLPNGAQETLSFGEVSIRL